MATNETYDLIVVGGGSVGLSTAYHATRRGWKTLLLERFGLFNDEGSSAGASRQFRLQYSEPYMSELVLASQQYWSQVQLHSQRTLVRQIGSVWFGDPALSSQEGGIQAAMNTMDSLSIPYQSFTNAASLEADQPFCRLPADYIGFLQPNGGIIDLKATERALFDGALQTGCLTVREWQEVTGLSSPSNGPIQVTTRSAEHTGERLAITSGPYANGVLAHLGIAVDIDIWEMSSAYFRKTDPNLVLPTWFVFQKPQETSLFYGFPEVDWANPGYLRVAPDIPDRVIKNPSERSGQPSQESLSLTSAWVRDHMVGLDPTPDFTSTCLIALSNASNAKELLLDHVPNSISNSERIVVYTAGWAAKFIPILGEMIARMLEGPVEIFDFGRYQINRSNFAIDWNAHATE